MRHIEHTLQRNMVNLFRMAYPQYKGVFFAVPNGGHRDIRVAQHMKAEGQLAGVSDLLLLVARKGLHGLCIEVKTKTGRQSERQKAFADAVIAQGYYYDMFCSSYGDYLRKTSVNLFGKTLDCKAFLEEYFNIDMTL